MIKCEGKYCRELIGSWVLRVAKVPQGEVDSMNHLMLFSLEKMTEIVENMTKSVKVIWTCAYKGTEITCEESRL